MKKLALRFLCAHLFLFAMAAVYPQLAHAQEASSGIDLRATITGEAAASNLLTRSPRFGSPVIGGFRSVLYPTFKLTPNWNVTAALQLESHPYFTESFTTQGYGEKGYVLQASLNYARLSSKGSLLLRAGELSSAFGLFPLHYDDADNALADQPMPYGYYGPVTTLGILGAQTDATRGRWDGRAQFANSSPANPRSIFAADQYGNWAGGGGYTIRQGLRVGGSAYRGPYLARNYKYFFPGEANPNTLPAHALGADIEWAHGHWNVQGEFQRFVLPYHALPIFREDAGYGEVKRALGPRWYVAGRTGYSSSSASGNTEHYEIASGFRPNTHQLLKVEYEFQHSSNPKSLDANTLMVQFVTTLHR